jgi:hypothetical protein
MSSIGFGFTIGKAKKAGGVSYDADAQAFFTATGITDTTQKSAVNQLVLDLKSYNIWTKMKAIYPIVGGTSTTHKYNLKDPQDTNAAFRLTFSTGFTHSSNGFVGNGAAYANPNLTPSTSLTVNNTHISFYLGTDTAAGNKVEMGVGVGGTLVPIMMLISKYTGNISQSNAYNLSTNQISSSNTDSKGFYLGTRTSSTSHKLFKGTSVLATDTNTNSNTLPNLAILISALNSNGAIVQNSDRRFQFVSIGNGLTDAEASNFYTAVQAFQTTLSRNV